MLTNGGYFAEVGILRDKEQTEFRIALRRYLKFCLFCDMLDCTASWKMRAVGASSCGNAAVVLHWRMFLVQDDVSG